MLVEPMPNKITTNHCWSTAKNKERKQVNSITLRRKVCKVNSDKDKNKGMDKDKDKDKERQARRKK